MTIRFHLLLLSMLCHLLLAKANPCLARAFKSTDARDLQVIWKFLCKQAYKRSDASPTSLSPRFDGAAEDKFDADNAIDPPSGKRYKTSEAASRAIKAPHRIPKPALDPISKQAIKNSADRKAWRGGEEPSSQEKGRKPGKKQKSKKGSKGSNEDSKLYFIRLPPTPYSYVPGLGYVSRPPSFSTSLLAGKQQPQPQPPRNPFIKLPIDFVSNGKPTTVYRWTPPDKHHHRDKYPADSPIIRLNRGPYVFDGKPSRISVMKKARRTTPKAQSLY